MEKIKISKAANKYSMLIILAVMILAISFLNDKFFTFTNIMNVLVSESGRGILALGVGLVIMSAGIDLSVGALVALSAVVTASLMQNPDFLNRIYPNLPILPVACAVLAAIALGVVFGTFSGVLVAYFKLPPFIATLGTQVIARGISYIYTDAYPVSMLRPEFGAIAKTNVGVIPIMVIIFAVLILVAVVLMRFTRFGENIYAIGGNQNAARVVGIHVERNQVLVYVWSAVLACIAGMLLAARSGSGTSSMGAGYELDAIAAATIGGVSQTGGVGTVGGIVVGVLVLGILNNGMLLLSVSPYWQQIVKGCIIIGAVMLDMRKLTGRK